MNMVEALEWAMDYVERAKLFESPANSRGYGNDKWTPPTADEKRAIITQLAKDACDDHPENRDLKFLRSVYHNLGEARIDSSSRIDMAAKHLDTIYNNVRIYLEGKK